MSRRVLIILNPTAAAGRAAAELTRLQPLIGELGLTVEVQSSQHAGHATALATAAADSRRYDCIAAGGGDGTAREVAAGVLASAAPSTPVAVLPLGTGNDLAHVAGAPRPADALRAIAAGITRPLDAIEVTCRLDDRTARTHAMSFAAVGLAADVVRYTTPRVKRWFGPKLCYSVGFFRALARYRPFAATAVCDGREFREAFLLICAGNTTHAGGQMMHLSPGAVPDDGRLNVSLIRATTRLEVALQFVRLLRGTHVHHRRATYFTGREIVVTTETPAELQLDGDCIGTTPATFRVMPRALQLVVKG
jgi:diacylglycerol kinase (ATP)